MRVEANCRLFTDKLKTYVHLPQSSNSTALAHAHQNMKSITVERNMLFRSPRRKLFVVLWQALRRLLYDPTRDKIDQITRLVTAVIADIIDQLPQLSAKKA